MNGNYTIQPPVLPRLTATQYINTVEDIFGENLPVILPSRIPILTFSILLVQQ